MKEENLSKEAGNQVIIKKIDLKFYEMGYIGTFSFSFLLKYLIVIISPQVMRCVNKKLTIRKLYNFCHFSKIYKANWHTLRTIKSRIKSSKIKMMSIFSKQNKKQDSGIDFDLLLSILINNTTSQPLSTRIFESDFNKYS
ncbi:MAG: hypothetical protein COB73_07085 [Flavobacteriaceae bacterium]|nr:MAG: hypothetical protein COB73_07085 [Flavobacteriaceae bacterium]